jgi:cell division protein FtsW
LAYKRGVGVESILMKHLAMIVGGIMLMYISHKLDYRYYAGLSKIMMIVTIPLLIIPWYLVATSTMPAGGSISRL